MPILTAILMIVFGIFLPSVDVYFDSYFSFKMFTFNETFQSYNETYQKYDYRQVGSQPLYGSLMLIPIIISTLFTLYHWWRLETKWWHKLLTLPLVLVQFWTQCLATLAQKLVMSTGLSVIISHLRKPPCAPSPALVSSAL